MGQRKAYTILTLIVALLVILLVFLANPFMGFVLLSLAIVGVCLLYKKKPWILDQFKKPGKDNGQDQLIQQKEDSFKVHIVLVNNNAVRPELINVDSPTFVIGRQPDCNYVIHNGRVSRSHAKILYDESSRKSYIVDPDSKSGTKVNGDTLVHGKRRQLFNGDIIQIEDTTFSVQTRNI